MSTDFFASNRNKFRKVVTYGARARPSIQAFVNNITGLSSSLDFSNVIRFHDMYRIGVLTPPITALVLPVAQYQEDLVTLTGTDSYSVSFGTPFTDTPIVTLEIDPADTGSVGFVNYYITAASSGGFTFGLSAPATGSIHFKAILLTEGIYPAVITRAPLFSSTTTTASAGAITLFGGSTVDVDLPFNSMGVSVPSEFSFTTLDNGNNQSDTYVSQSALTNTDASVDLSANFVGTIDYIAIK